MKLTIAAGMASMIFLTPPAGKNYLIVGTYDSPKSEGIYVYTFDNNSGEATAVSHVKTSNPSFISISPDQRFVYSGSESGNKSEVAAFSFSKKDGSLTLLNKQLSQGDNPCYVQVDRTGKWLFAGNYSSGNFSVYPINPDGSLKEASTTIKHEGKGKDIKRQEGPHVHCTVISPDNKWLFVPDLGIDKVMIYAFDDKTGTLTTAEQPFAASEPGSGPRHFIIHPKEKYAYVIEELSGTVQAFEYKKGKLDPIQRISTMVEGDNRYPGSADIHISAEGKFLYASNRGEVNSIAIFSIKKNGQLKLEGHQSTLGKGPRNFSIDPSGKYLLVGNQNTDEIVIFNRDGNTGLLSDSGKRIKLGKPVCLKWMNLSENNN